MIGTFKKNYKHMCVTVYSCDQVVQKQKNPQLIKVIKKRCVDDFWVKWITAAAVIVITPKLIKNTNKSCHIKYYIKEKKTSK